MVCVIIIKGNNQTTPITAIEMASQIDACMDGWHSDSHVPLLKTTIYIW